MTDPTPAEVLTAVANYIAAKNTFLQQQADWQTGTATGGPLGDGRYPFTSFEGVESLLASPPAIAQQIRAEVGIGGDYDCDLVTTYGHLINGGDITAALQAFWDDNTKSRLHIPVAPAALAGRSWTITTTRDTSAIDKFVTCDPGVIITQTSYPALIDQNYPSPITQEPPILWMESVTAQVETTAMIGIPGSNPARPGGNPLESNVVQLGIANPRSVKKGDILRIISDDTGPYMRDLPGIFSQPNFRNADAEFVTVGADSTGTTITLTSALSGKYLTNVRVYALSGKRFEWRGAEITQAAGGLTFAGGTPVSASANNAAYAAIELRNLLFPKIEGLRTRDLWHAGVRIFGTLGTTVSHYIPQRHRNDVQRGFFGYGIVDGGQNTLIERPVFLDVRHGVTTGVNCSPIGLTAAQTTRPWLWGGARNGLVVYGVGIGCSGTPYDTHEDAQVYTFFRCHAEGSYWGSDSPAGAYSVRGADVSIIDCTYRNIDWVISGSPNRNLKVRGMRGTNIRRRAFLFSLPSTTADATSTGHVIEDSEFDGVPQFEIQGMNSRPPDFELRNVTLRPRGFVPWLFTGAGFDLRVRGLRIDMSLWAGSTAQNLGVLHFPAPQSGQVIVDFDDVPISRPFSPSATNPIALTTAETARTNVRGTVTRIRYTDENPDDGIPTRDWAGSTPLNPFGIRGTIPGLSASGIKLFDTGRVSSKYASVPVASGTPLDISRIADSEIFLTLTGSLAEPAELGALATANRSPGDQVALINRAGAAVTVAGITIADGRAGRLMFDGSGWAEF